MANPVAAANAMNNFPNGSVALKSFDWAKRNFYLVNPGGDVFSQKVARFIGRVFFAYGAFYLGKIGTLFNGIGALVNGSIGLTAKMQGRQLDNISHRRYFQEALRHLAYGVIDILTFHFQNIAAIGFAIAYGFVPDRMDGWQDNLRDQINNRIYFPDPV